MARIRTIKPDFFRHEGLYEAEISENLPIRIAFAGLWTASCREGRFKWMPKTLKLDCLPHDDVDFSRVLDALWTRGFIEKYSVSGEVFGFIPSWHEHQVINNRETESNLPEPIESSIVTRAGRVQDACSTRLKGKGREGKGREGNKEVTFSTFMESIPDDQDAIPKDHHVFTYADKVKLPLEFLDLQWVYFERYYGSGAGKAKRYKDWPGHFRTAVESGYGKLWAIAQDGSYYLTTAGKQLQMEVSA